MRRHKRPILIILPAVVALLVVLVGLPLGKRYWPWEGHRLIVVSYNAGNNGAPPPSPALVARSLSRTGPPDLVMLQEAGSLERIETIAALLELPHVAVGTIPMLGHQERLALLSRHELSRRHVLALCNGTGGGALLAEMDSPGGAVLVGSVHMDTVYPQKRTTEGYVVVQWHEAARTLYREILTSTRRSRGARELVDHLETIRAATAIIGGDLNTVPLSRCHRILTRELDDALWPSAAWFQGSYRKIHSPIRPRIDHLLHRGAARPVASSVLPDTAGDHHPVRTEFIIIPGG